MSKPVPPTEIEIFRAGSHRDMNGESLAFGVGDLEQIAAGYSTAHAAPIVVGHPAIDAPAYGWIKSVAVRGDRLVATTEQVDPAFAEAVNQGRYKNVSVALWRPTDQRNPTPGKWALRHLGFLGAAAPAVRGLKQVAFAADDGFVAFAMPGTPVAFAMPTTALGILGLLRSVRDLLIGTAGIDAADRALPSDRLDFIQSLAEDEAADEAAEEAAEGMTDQDPIISPGFAQQKEEDMTAQAEALAAERRALDAAKAELEAKQLAFAAERDRHFEVEAVAFADELVAKGRLPKGLKDDLVTLSRAMNAAEPVAFSAEGQAEKPFVALKRILGSLVTPPATGVHPAFAAGDAGDMTAHSLARAATRLVAEEKAKGVDISHGEAVARLAGDPGAGR